MPVPEGEKEHLDVIDLIIDGCGEQVVVTDKQGNSIIEQRLNTDKAYYKTQLVNYPGFSRFVLELENLKSMAKLCKYHMSSKRAAVLSEQILAYVNSFKLSIDAKSSESLRDIHNTQSPLIHVLTRNKIERSYTVEEEAKKTFLEGVFGRDKAKDSQDR